MIEKFRELPLPALNDFRKTGESKLIPEDLQQYILHIGSAVEIHKIEGNISRAAKQLQKKFEGICFNTARNRVYDAINIFHVNSTVLNEAWDQYYADKFEDGAKIALKGGDVGEWRRCLSRAHECRTNRDEAAYDPATMRPIDEIISPDVTHERLGITKMNKKQLWIDSKKFINDLDLKSEEKDKLLEEIAIELNEALDVDHEEVK